VGGEREDKNIMSRFLIFVAVLAFVGIFVYVFGFHAKGTNGYACALEVSRRSPVVADELGAPVEAGLFAWTSHYSQEGSVTDASFRTTLEGPKGKGGLRVRWYASPVGSAMRVVLERGGRTRVVYEGTIPCR
jgi:hypothetical protein